MTNMDDTRFTPTEIRKIGVNVIITALRTIGSFINDNPQMAFKPITIGKKGKTILSIDYHAELACVDYLSRKYHDKIEVFGEERLSDEDPDLSNKQKLIALVDMVDGTDLLKRGLSNWCSAVIFFHPAQGKILGAFVGIPSDGIYYATAASGAYKQLLGSDNQLLRKSSIKLQGTSKISRLEKASVCFYGQKIYKLLSVLNNRKFIKNLGKLKEEEGIETRIYNFAGNPMMVKLAEGQIDAVFDLEGQYPHDVAPGAFIAKKAGAVFRDMKGNDIDLLPALLKPAKSRIKYILASTPKLFKEIQSAIG